MRCNRGDVNGVKWNRMVSTASTFNHFLKNSNSQSRMTNQLVISNDSSRIFFKLQIKRLHQEEKPSFNVFSLNGQ